MYVDNYDIVLVRQHWSQSVEFKEPHSNIIIL